MVVSKKERLKKELDSAISDNNLELALAVTEDMVDLDPDSVEYHTSKSVIMAKLGMFEESIKEIDIALSIDKKDSKAWYSKGCILMDNQRARPALACFYKSLDVDPGQERARNRFNKCLDQMISETEVIEKEIYQDGPTLIHEDPSIKPVFKADFSDRDDEDDSEVISDLPEDEPDLPQIGRDGSYLDDDLFEDDEEEEDEEDWGDDEFDEWGDEDGSSEEVESWGEDDDNEPVGSIECRCGEEIKIHSDTRPYRFECLKCGRKGTLR